MPAIDIETYIKCAEKTGSFMPEETGVLREVLTECFSASPTTYILMDERNRGCLRGFIIFGRTPMTERGWDIYWIVVDISWQRKGIGHNLLEKMRRRIAKDHNNAVIRIETAGKASYSHVRNFYIKAGFAEAGRVPDFYAKGDDMVVFWKKI